MSETNSLERMLGILNLFDEAHPEWTPEELQARLGYSRPTLYRYLKTLKESGLIVSVREAAYTLGPKVVEMDFLLRKADPLVVEGEPLLTELASKYPGTAFLSRWYRDRVLCVVSVRTSDEAVSSYPRGRPMPVGRGATSHAILAFLPEAEQEELLGNWAGHAGAFAASHTRELVRANLAQTRLSGYSVNPGLVLEGSWGMGAAVFDAAGRPAWALSLTGIEPRFKPERQEELGGLLMAEAHRITQQLGGEGKGARPR